MCRYTAKGGEQECDLANASAFRSRKDGRGRGNDDRRAAIQGLVNAQYYLGAIYSDGKGIIQDQKQAVHWWR
jgi:TPR repeat protein